MTSGDLYDAMVIMCREYGYPTGETYDLLHAAIDTIGETPEDDEPEPMDMSGSTPGVER